MKMWRYLTRGIQQGFKRSLCLEKPETSVKERKPGTNHCCFIELLPSAIRTINHCSSKHDDQSQRGSKTYKNPRQHSLLEAFGWSGALVFGWLISKQLWLTNTWTREQDMCLSKTRREKNILNQSFIEVLANIVKTQPPATHILPQLQSTKQIKILESNESKALSDDEFEDAAKELQEIHNKAMGEALNRRGIACLSRSTGTEAISYFKRASELKYPPASFNMGQCCELGIGTKQDFKEAAEWYKIAAAQGHATAMYNLGVFYAHGWGGLQADVDSAKKMFDKAAKLGQPDAKAALEIESKHISDMLSNASNADIPFLNGCESKPSFINSRDLNFFINTIRIGLNDEVIQKDFGPENKWDFPLNRAVAL